MNGIDLLKKAFCKNKEREFENNWHEFFVDKNRHQEFICVTKNCLKDCFFAIETRDFSVFIIKILQEEFVYDYFLRTIENLVIDGRTFIHSELFYCEKIINLFKNNGFVVLASGEVVSDA